MAAANIARKQGRDTLVVILDDPGTMPGAALIPPGPGAAWASARTTGAAGVTAAGTIPGSTTLVRLRSWYGGWYDPWYAGWYDPFYYDPWYGGYGYGYGWYGHRYGWYDQPYYYGGGWGGNRYAGRIYTPRSTTEAGGSRMRRPGSGSNYRYGTPGSAGGTVISARSTPHPVPLAVRRGPQRRLVLLFDDPQPRAGLQPFPQLYQQEFRQFLFRQLLLRQPQLDPQLFVRNAAVPPIQPSTHQFRLFRSYAAAAATAAELLPQQRRRLQRRWLQEAATAAADPPPTAVAAAAATAAADADSRSRRVRSRHPDRTDNPGLARITI